MTAGLDGGERQPSAMSKTQSNVDRIHQQLRRMAADFEFMPDARINESALATQLNASRTPIREALNRLVAEGYLTFQSRRGFFCRPLNPKRIHDLYEARSAIECEGLRRAVERASDSDIQRLVADLDQTEPTYDKCDDPIDLLAMDEAFHMRLIQLSGNDELVRMLENLNGRVRYVRLINLRYLRSGTPITAGKAGKLSGHRKVLIALSARDESGAVRAMRNHIERRREETTEAVRIAYSQLYVPGD
jgi:DNA-binding GntR family transcriptional regulator